MTAGHPLTGPIRVPPLFPGGVAVSDLCVYDTEGDDDLGSATLVGVNAVGLVRTPAGRDNLINSSI